MTTTHQSGGFSHCKEHVNAEVTPRSMNLSSSSIPENHGLVQAGIALGRTTYGSPTLSDQSVLSCQIRSWRYLAVTFSR
jgi:cytochrome c peroxidase